MVAIPTGNCRYFTHTSEKRKQLTVGEIGSGGLYERQTKISDYLYVTSVDGIQAIRFGAHFHPGRLVDRRDWRSENTGHGTSISTGRIFFGHTRYGMC
jgi:hypothetical protein